MILSLSERMIRASPSSDPVSVLRTSAIRVPSGEILNAVTPFSVLQHRCGDLDWLVTGGHPHPLPPTLVTDGPDLAIPGELRSEQIADAAEQ